MIKKLLNKKLFLILLTLLLVVSSSISPQVTVYAEDIEYKAQISVNSDADCYYFSMYLSGGEYDNSEVEIAYYYNINGIWVTAIEEGFYEFNTPEKNFSVYGKITVINNGVMTEYLSDTISFSPYGASTNQPTTATKIVNIATPIILSIIAVLLILFLIIKEKPVLLKKILLDLNYFSESLNTIKNTMKDDNMTAKKKLKFYKRQMNIINKKIYGNINNLISLNIDSMGQYNCLLSNLIELENIVKASTKVTALNDSDILIKNCNKIVKKVLPSILVNAQENYDSFIKAENLRQSMFTQHVKASHSLDNLNNSKEYLEKTLYKGQDDDDD